MDTETDGVRRLPVSNQVQVVSATTSSKGILIDEDTQSRPVRKSPRLHERDDDEVVVVPPPPKVYTIVDLTEEGTEAASAMELNAPQYGDVEDHARLVHKLKRLIRRTPQANHLRTRK